MTEWAILGLIGVCGVLRSYFDIRGYAIGEASAVAPFQYARLIFIGIAGYVLFNETVTVNTLLGAGIIFTSTAYIARREAVLKKSLKTADEPTSAAP
jgi:drug/metabolite transporter (DMT)-like permease